MYKPYPSQQREIDKIVDFINSGTKKKGIFIAPVAFGKSIVIANVAMAFPNKYFINVCPNKELTLQNYEKYVSYGYEASICSASLGENEVSKVTFATIGTLKKHYEFFKDKEVVILNDEAHDSSLRGSELDKFYKKLKKCSLIGVTATAMRLNNKMGGAELTMMNRQRDCIYTSIESVVQVSDVIKEGRWAKLIYEVENVDEKTLKLNTTGSDYTLKSLIAFSEINGIQDKCIRHVERLRKQGRKSCIIYVSTIDEANNLSKKIKSCESLHSNLKQKERTEIINDFKSGKLQTIVNVGILKQGFDYPELSSIILARPTNSYTLYSQVIGRAVRIHKDKKDAIIVDISGNYNKFGGIEDLEYVNEPYTEGWAAFSGDKLLTGYALGSGMCPTRDTLKQIYEKKLKKELEDLNPRFEFGKFKGQRFKYVKQKNMQYLAWMINPETNFNFNRVKNGNAIKQAIYRELKLAV